MPDEPNQILEWVKIIASIVGGGFAGAILTNIISGRRNRVQPIGRKITVSYIDLPKIMKGHEALISFTGNEAAPSPHYLFKQLAIIQLELVNIGNKDIEKFDCALTIPEESKIIGVQSGTPGRLHKFNSRPEISITQPSSQIDLTFLPFNRKDKYNISLVVDSASKSLRNEITLDKVLPVKFVHIDNINTEFKFLISLNIGTVVLTFLMAGYTKFFKAGTDNHSVALLLAAGGGLLLGILLILLMIRKQKKDFKDMLEFISNSR